MRQVNLFLLVGLAIQAYHNNAYNVNPTTFTSSRFLSRTRRLAMVATDAPPAVEDFSVAGMFTNTSPETRRVIPATNDGKVKFKIVYVVLESQYQSALTKACQSINKGKESVAIEAVGYLLEELRNPKILEQFKEDVASANIFIGSLIFVQELADKASHHKSYHCDVICFASGHRSAHP